MAKRKGGRARGGRGDAAQQATGGDPNQRRWLVVFREPSEKNVTTFEKHVRRLKPRASAVGPSVAAFGTAGEDRPQAQVYQTLAVAAGDLTADEREGLLAENDVEDVVPEETRYVQMLPKAGIGQVPAGGTVGTMGGAGTGAGPFGVEVLPPDPFSVGPGLLGVEVGPADPFGVIREGADPFGVERGPRDPFNVGPADAGLMTYVRGWRDALDMILAAGGAGGAAGGGSAPAQHAAARAADTDAATYGLLMTAVLAAAASCTGTGVKVAVLDTGIDTTHADFADRFADGARLRSFVLGEDVMDQHGHGTHVGGTVGGPADHEAERRYGVAPECDLFVGKVLSNAGSGSDRDILTAIAWAMDNGCRVINMSLGSARAPGQPFSVAYQRAAESALNRPGGAVVVAAAGNESRRPGTIAAVGNPAACPAILAVAAVDAAARIAWFSCGQRDNIGLVDIAGPGVEVYSSVPVAKGRYDRFSGTSMAAPHVAGIMALFAQNRPNLTPRELWSLTKSAARPLRLAATDVGRGLVQAPRTCGA